ncbi:30S ribosomal protein S6 [Candidatus Falkowbacteria bacterium]|nr:30S ribosomal protein S6 [Candidatus Falkowbacteria bacterium]
MTNNYELLYLISGNYTDKELTPTKELVKNLIAKFGGEIKSEDSLGKKKLAYPVKGDHQGYYLIYQFDMDGNNLAELNKNLKLTNEILRHVIVKKELKPSRPIRKAVNRIGITEEKSVRPKIQAKEDKPENKDDNKIKLEDLDEKLDEILEGDII